MVKLEKAVWGLAVPRVRPLCTGVCGGPARSQLACDPFLHPWPALCWRSTLTEDTLSAFEGPAVILSRWVERRLAQGHVKSCRCPSQLRLPCCDRAGVVSITALFPFPGLPLLPGPVGRCSVDQHVASWGRGAPVDGQAWDGFFGSGGHSHCLLPTPCHGRAEGCMGVGLGLGNGLFLSVKPPGDHMCDDLAVPGRRH